MTELIKADREALIRVVKDRAKLAERDAHTRAKVLLAEVHDLMTAEFAANDALWNDLLLAQEAVAKLNAQIREQCAAMGIPAKYAPGIGMHWHSRSLQFADKERRAELQRLAEARLSALTETARVEIQRQALDVTERLIVGGLESEEARRFIETLPTVEDLMPPLSLADLGVKRWQPPEDAAAQLVTPLTPADRKRRRILRAIEANPGASDRRIAEIADCDHKTVARFRRDGIPHRRWGTPRRTGGRGMRFTIPADPDQADALAGELGELATATEWRRAAIVYSRVHVRDSQGRPTEKVTSDHLMTPAEYADKGVYGLRSRTTIRAYWRAWHQAIADGLAQTVSLGDEIELPSVEWNDYYRPLDLTTPPAAADYVPPPPNDGDTNVVSMPARDSSTRRDALGGLFNRMGSCTDVTISEPARAPGPPVDYHELLRDQHHARVLDQVDAVRDSDAARITDSEAARIRRKVDRDNVEMWLRLTEDNSLRAAEAAERCGRFDHAERLLDQIETIRDRLAAIAHTVREARPWETLDPSALTLDPLVENGIPASVLPASTQIYTLGEAPVRRTAPSPV